MNIEREFTVFENDTDWKKRKRLILLEADDFRKAIFTIVNGLVNYINSGTIKIR
jgi:hypothetical protein